MPCSLGLFGNHRSKRYLLLASFFFILLTRAAIAADVRRDAYIAIDLEDLGRQIAYLNVRPYFFQLPEMDALLSDPPPIIGYPFNKTAAETGRKISRCSALREAHISFRQLEKLTQNNRIPKNDLNQPLRVRPITSSAPFDDALVRVRASTQQLQSIFWSVKIVYAQTATGHEFSVAAEAINALCGFSNQDELRVRKVLVGLPYLILDLSTGFDQPTPIVPDWEIAPTPDKHVKVLKPLRLFILGVGLGLKSLQPDAK